MIQRIQTLFLLIAVGLISILLFLPLATIVTPDTQYLLQADGLVNTMSEDQATVVSWAIFAMVCVMVLVPLIAIFLFKKRLLQIRVAIFSSILNVLFYGLMFFEISSLLKALPGAEVSYAWTLICPAVAIIFNILAIRKIGHDEMLIRSLNSNRIR